jgi:hypothetical protein
MDSVLLVGPNPNPFYNTDILFISMHDLWKVEERDQIKCTRTRYKRGSTKHANKHDWLYLKKIK